MKLLVNLFLLKLYARINIFDDIVDKYNNTCHKEQQ